MIWLILAGAYGLCVAYVLYELDAAYRVPLRRQPREPRVEVHQ